jgi:hypothetical protein
MLKRAFPITLAAGAGIGVVAQTALHCLSAASFPFARRRRHLLCDRGLRVGAWWIELRHK